MSIAAYVGYYHIMLYFKRRKDRFNLSFAMVCLSLAAYDLFSAGLYSVSSPIEGAPWQRGQITSLAMIIGSTIVFVFDTVQRRMTLPIRLILFVIGALIPVNLFTSWGVIDGQPDIKHITWLGITYNESALGPGVTILFIIAIPGMLYTATLVALACRTNRALRPILILLVIFFTATINDISVSSGIYPSIYLVEYGFFLFTMAMAHSLLSKFVKALKAEEELTLRLEERVSERTRQLEEAHQVLVEEAHRAGMASIATGVLHNMGNALNSVRTCVVSLITSAADPALNRLKRANDMLRDKMVLFEEVFAQDQQSRQLFEFYLALEESFGQENTKLNRNAERLSKMTDSMCQLVEAQQSYADLGSFTEQVELSRVIDDALMMKQATLDKHRIAVRREFQSAPRIEAQKSKLLHICVNLVTNGIEAIAAANVEKPLLVITIAEREGGIAVIVEDNGEGIEAAHLATIFSSGYTTRKGADGFGLHSSANYMTEMGGSISASSDGPGMGARFELSFPNPTDTLAPTELKTETSL